MAKERVGVYPGTFDPITLGHLDIIRRGEHLVDRLVIGVTTNITKSPMFDDDERIAMVKAEVASIEGDIRVVGFNSLLMDFAEREGATVIVRGLRAVADLIRQKAISAVVVLFGSGGEKVSLLAAVTADLLAKGWDARQLLKEAGAWAGGGGGGRPDLAQGGGKDASRLAEAVTALREAFIARLSA